MRSLKNRITKYCRLIFVIALGVCLQQAALYGQNITYAQGVLYFQQGDYASATPVFEKLMLTYKKEPTYHYYLGVCYVQQNIRLNEAVSLLKFAAAKARFSDTYYYLAKAYTYLYRFNEAKVALDKFHIFATRQDLKQYDTELLYKHIKQAGLLTAKTTAYTLLSKSEFQWQQPDVLNSFSIEGQFVPVPDDYKGTAFLQENLDNLAYKSSLGIFYSAYNYRTRSYDIFLAADAGEAGRALPESVNSTANECYAWFDNRSNYLYFASDGAQSMGGFDVFRVQYIPSRKSWGVPENLGFPVNTVNNEWYCLQLPNGQLIVSDRQFLNKNFSAYKVKQTGVAQQSELNSGELYRLSLLETGVISNSGGYNEAENKKGGTTISAPQNAYEKNLYKALNYQLKADSFLRAARQKRADVKKVTQQSTRNQLFAEIIDNEAQQKLYQQKADDLYSRLYSAEAPGQQAPEQGSVVQMRGGSASYKKEAETRPLSQFEVRKNPAYSSIQQITVNEKPPDYLLYKIQLGVFSKSISPERFGGLYPITADYLSERQLTKYYCGKFTSYTDAAQGLKQVKILGFSDAYLVAFYQGKKIPVVRAREIENNLN